MMIISKKRFKELKELNEILKKDNLRLTEYEKHHQNLVYEVDKTLMNILKAILYKFENNEIIITDKDIEQAQRGNIFMTDEAMQMAKRVQLLFKENKMKEV